MAMAELSTGDERKTKRWGGLLARGSLLYSRVFAGIAKPSLCSGVLRPPLFFFSFPTHDLFPKDLKSDLCLIREIKEMFGSKC